MQDSGKLAISLRGIAHILRDQSLEVPPFQRNYSWNDDQVDEYWFDLKAALTVDQSFYFLGTVVLGKADSGAGSVIDGQQRLATTSMLLAAARDIFNQRGDTKRAATLQTMYIAAPSLAENRTLPKLHLNEADQRFFETRVLGLPAEANEVVEVRPEIDAAFIRLVSRLTDDVESAGPRWEDRLLRWVKMLEERAQVIVVSVEDDSDAFVIFETLNDRGMELSVADLIKNYLLGLSRNDIKHAQELWIAANHAIEAVANSKEVTSFIRQWWSSQQGATRERDLYRSLRTMVRSSDAAVTTLREIARSAPAYAALIDPRHEYWVDFSKRTTEAVTVLVDLGLEQYRPLALAAMRTLPPTEIERLFEALVGWSVRGIIVGGIGGGSAERLYAETAVRVTNGRATTVEAIGSELDRMIAHDKEFESAFSDRRILRTPYLRYFLQAIAAGDALLRPNPEGLVAVGLFPRTDPGGVWAPHVEDDVRRQLSARIGNFALLRADDVHLLPTDPAMRLEFFRQHDQLPPDIVSIWTEISAATVDERQRLLASQAVQVWPFIPLEPRLWV